jgi:hypothetical protein
MTQPQHFDPNQITDQTIGFFDRQECISMNLAFFRAMKAAVESGGESKRNFTYGPKVDDTPLVGAYIDRQLRHSPMSSSANACLNMTLDTSRPMPLTSVTQRPNFK